MQKTDTELIIAYEEGDPQAIDTLVKRHLSSVYSLVYRLMGNPEEAQDLTQETFMKAWKSLSSFDKSRNFKTWIFRIARNTSIDYLRKKKAVRFSDLDRGDDAASFESNIPDKELLPDEMFEKKENEAALEAALAGLSPDERSLISLHHEDDLSFEEIGEVVGKPMNTVKSQYRRALIKLKARLHQRPL